MAKQKKPKLMSSYELDLTWMAYRYAIGRHTIAASSIQKEMAKNVYLRLTRSRSEFMAQDIQKEIADHLRFYPFSFTMNYNIPTDDVRFVPIDRFIEYMMSADIKSDEELQNFSHIECNWDRESDTFNYITEEKKDKTGYLTHDWEDLMEWSNLAKLLNFKCHKYCIAKNPENGEDVMIEYFETYRRKSYKTLEFEKIKVPCQQYSDNAYICSRIEESYITKDNLEGKEVLKFAKEHDIDNPFHLDKEK